MAKGQTVETTSFDQIKCNISFTQGVGGVVGHQERNFCLCFLALHFFDKSFHFVDAVVGFFLFSVLPGSLRQISP